MTKITQSQFETDITEVKDNPPAKTYQQKLAEWRKANEGAYKKARKSCYVCSPTRTELLLVQQYEEVVPIDF
jgi:hypothetical protein